MATVYGDTSTAVYTGGLSGIMSGGWQNGRVKVFCDSYTLAGTEAAGTVIQFGGYSTAGYIPAGATILAIAISTSTVQAALTFSLGNGASATAYVAAGKTSLQTIGINIFPGQSTVVGTTTGDNYVLLTTAAAVATAGELKCYVLYTTD
jgi:hypothetical protein